MKERTKLLLARIDENHDWLRGKMRSGGGTEWHSTDVCQVCSLRRHFQQDDQNDIPGHYRFSRGGHDIPTLLAVNCGDAIMIEASLALCKKLGLDPTAPQDKPHIVIWLRGGLVDSVASAVPLTYIVVDEDVSGVPREDTLMVDGRRVCCHIEDACINPEQVQEVLKATQPSTKG